jgi:hypothetical protein
VEKRRSRDPAEKAKRVDENMGKVQHTHTLI